ncbi:MAG: TIGR03560 family F420-dependent LLM class oxidoreductase [Pseudomonadales bacterium]|nr:TIGR03560 family F420-dependent LLM class oxidoreductase [Pseudomonadales bacterium]
MKFGFWPQATQSFTAIQGLAQHIAHSDWHGLWLADHFMPNASDTRAPTAEVWTTLAALAATVERLRLGALVSGNTYRHPAILAKMASTIDHISDGRLVLGLGSAWQKNEHDKYGIPFYTVNGRLRRLEEACQVIKALFTEDQANFQGEFYQLTDAPLVPKPRQKNLPLLIGGGGEKVTLKIAAQYADEWNVWGTPELLHHKMHILDQHCNNVNRDPTAIKRSAVSLVFISDDARAIKKMQSRIPGRPLMTGSLSQIQDTVAQYQEIGLHELIIPDFNMGHGNSAQKRDRIDEFIAAVANL